MDGLALLIGLAQFERDLSGANGTSGIRLIAEVKTRTTHVDLHCAFKLLVNA
jgi:hypothetical protein